MASLIEIVKQLDEELHIRTAQDYSCALNGLQVENNHHVTKIGSAVDASERVINMAIEEGVDLLLVHHGLFWQGLRPLTGALYRKVKKILDHNISLYSAHLPLDAHPRFGNSFLLAERIPLLNIEPASPCMGSMIGVRGILPTDLNNAEALTCRLEVVLGSSIQLAHAAETFSPEVTIVSGGSGNEIESLYKQGVRTLITGEGAHWTVPLAQELDMTLIYAGHYATETLGVQALAQEISAQYGLPHCFLDAPTHR